MPAGENWVSSIQSIPDFSKFIDCLAEFRLGAEPFPRLAK
jgi:hypothetical protein